jgi:hypothetical protein
MSETKATAPMSEAKKTVAPTTEQAIQRADFQALEKVKVAGELDLLTAAKAFAASGMFPDVRTQSQAIVKIVAGYEIGIPPFASMQGFHAIPRRKKVDGKWIEEVEISMSANLRAAVIRRDPNIDIDIVETTNEACEIEVAVRFAGQWKKRRSVRYTIEDARRVKVPAGEGTTRPLADGHMWKNYPADMLFAAVMRRISKRYAPHLFIGDQRDDNDLIAAEADSGQSDVVDGELVEQEFQQAEHGMEGADSGETCPEVAGSDDLNAGPAATHESNRTAGEPENAPAELFGDTPEDLPPAPEETEDSGEEEQPSGVYVGFLFVTPAMGAHEPAPLSGKPCAPQQLDGIKRILARLNLVDAAIDAICEARYGFRPATEMSIEQAQSLGEWLKAQEKLLAAKAGG